MWQYLGNNVFPNHCVTQGLYHFGCYTVTVSVLFQCTGSTLGVKDLHLFHSLFAKHCNLFRFCKNSCRNQIKHMETNIEHAYCNVYSLGRTEVATYCNILWN